MSDIEDVGVYAIGADNPLLSFLDRMERIGDFAARRRRSYELLGLCAGARVADIGCGAGAAVREMAALVAPDGAAAGVDVNEPLIEIARARAAHAGLSVELHVGSVDALPFADASLDGYRAERLYQHLPQPVGALAEARRVLAPGGRIVLVDQDWDALLLDSGDLATTRSIVRAFCDGIVNGTIGRQHRRLLGDAGFEDVRVEADAFAATSFEEYGPFVETLALGAEMRGLLSSAAAAAWIADQRERARRGQFFLVMTHFLATGRR